MQDHERTVFIVEDDHSMRDALGLLVRTAGLAYELYPSALSFLESYHGDRAGCLVLDVRLPGMSGFDLQRTLGERGDTIPIIMITGHGDVPMAVRAMKAGAMEFLEKPFNDQDLLDCIHRALATNAVEREQRQQRQTVLRGLAKLTDREAEVLQKMVLGDAAKTIAADLGISRKTVDVHRANILAKLNVDSVVQLAHQLQQCDITSTTLDRLLRPNGGTAIHGTVSIPRAALKNARRATRLSPER